MRKSSFDLLEKSVLILVLSYIISIVTGLAFISAHIEFSANFFVISLWLFTFLIKVFRYTVMRRGLNEVNSLKEEVWSIDLAEFGLIFTLFLIMLVTSYNLVLSPGPFGGITRGDVPSYCEGANEIVYFKANPPLVPYVWLNVYIWVSHVVTGLPMLYAYTGLQFLVLLTPMSLYVLLKALFKENKKIACVGAVLISMMQGMCALIFLSALIESPNLYVRYMAGDVGILNDYLLAKTRLGMTETWALSPGALDCAVIVLAMAYAYKYLTTDEQGYLNLFLCALLANTALLTHNIHFSLCLFATLMLFTLLRNVPLKKLIKIVVLAITLLFPLDFLSRSFFSNYVLDQYLLLTISFIRSDALSGFVFSVIAVLGIYSILVLFRARIISSERMAKERILQFLGKRSVGFFLVILATLIFIMSIYACAHARFADYRASVWPWYVIATRGWGLLLLIALGSFSYLYARFRGPNLTFVLCWVASLALLGSFGVMNSSVLSPTWSNRLLIFICFPLTCLTAAVLSEFIPLIKGIKIRFGGRVFFAKFAVPAFLIGLLTVSFLSYVYRTEYFYSLGIQRRPLPPSYGEAAEWIEGHLQMDAAVLPLSQDSYRILCNIVSCKVLPLSKYFTPYFSFSWVRDILLECRLPEPILYALAKLDVSHIFVTSSEKAQYGEAFLSILDVFPIVYQEEDIEIYEVPPYPLYEDSNYVLVPSTEKVTVKTLDMTNESMVGSWSFEDGGGLTTRDSSIYQNDGTLCPFGDSPVWVNGRYGKGLSFDGVDSNVSVNISSSLSINGAFTIEAWIKCLGRRSRRIIGKTGPGGDFYDGGYGLEVQADGTIQGYFSNGTKGGNSGNWDIVSSTTKVDNAWHYIVFTWDGTTNVGGMKIYIDGFLNGEATALQNFIAGNNFPVVMGKYYADLLAFEGVIDEVRIYNRSLLAYEIEARFKNPNATIALVREASVFQRTDRSMALNLLMVGRNKFSVAYDIELSSLKPDYVYLFPYGRHLPAHVMNTILSSVSKGAHIVFTDPSFASFDDLGQASTVGFGMDHMLTSSEGGNASCIVFDDQKIKFDEVSIPEKIYFINETEMHVLANYVLAGNSRTPYIAYKCLGKGSVTFVYLSPLKGMEERMVRKEILLNTLNVLKRHLPDPNSPQKSLSLAYPLPLFEYIIPSRTNLWHLKKLHGYMQFHDDVKIVGDFTLESEYIHLSQDKLSIGKIMITNTSETTVLEGEVLYDLEIRGGGFVSSQFSKGTLYNYPDGITTLASVTDYVNSSITLTNADIIFRTCEDDHTSSSHWFGCNVTLYPVDDYAIQVRQPNIRIDGVLEGNLQGSFFHEDLFFYAVTESHVAFDGNFTLMTYYFPGLISTRMANIDCIQILSYRLSAD